MSMSVLRKSLLSIIATALQVLSFLCFAISMFLSSHLRRAPIIVSFSPYCILLNVIDYFSINYNKIKLDFIQNTQIIIKN